MVIKRRQSDDDSQDVSAQVSVNSIGLIWKYDGSLMEPIKGDTSASWLTCNVIQENVLTWLLQGGHLFEGLKTTKGLFVELVKNSDAGQCTFWGCAGYAFPHAKQDPSQAAVQWTEQLTTAFPCEKFATVHLQARQDLVHTLVAPARVRIWLHAFRRVNEHLWTDIGDALDVLDLSENNSRHVVHKLRERLVHMFKKDSDTLFSAIEPHLRTAEDSQASAAKNWHTDAFTSLMHMSITLQGERTLGFIAGGESHQLRLRPGMVYLGNPAAYHHAVYDHQQGVPNLSLQCRLGFPAWNEDRAGRPSPWGRHGFNPWSGELTEAVQALSPSIATAFQKSSHRYGGVRLPSFCDLAECAAHVSGGEHGWFYYHKRPRAWSHANDSEHPRDY